MDWITFITNWFGENESVLSGIAAFVVITGLLLTPLGRYFKIFLAKTVYPDDASPAPANKIRKESKPAIYIESFTGNSDEANNFALELNEDVRRAVTNLTGSILVNDVVLADYIAYINVQLTGSHSRVTLRLLDRDNNEDFWSGRFEADIENKFEAIDQLTAKLSSSLRYEVSIRFTSREDNSFEVELGRMGFAMISFDPAVWAEARQSAERWLKEKSDNSMLHAIYGGLLMNEIAHGYRPSTQADSKKGEQALRQAVVLNKRSDFAQNMLGRFLLYDRLDFAGARAAYSRSLEINPLYNLGIKGLAIMDIYAGDTERGLGLCKDTNPSTQRFEIDEQAMRTVAAGELRLGNYNEALAWAERAIHHAGIATTPSLIMLAAAAGLAGNDHVASRTVNSLKEKHPEITTDAMRRWPYQDDADWELFVSGLRKAGLD
jgi:tetratricopeptide (TPR) repeat protein